MLDKLQPNFKERNFSGAVMWSMTAANITPKLQDVVEQKSDNEGPLNNVINETQVDIVCISPRTGSLYQGKVSLPKDTSGISDVEDGTSENSKRLRQVASSIYEEIFETPTISKTQEEVNEDREMYERGLKKR